MHLHVSTLSRALSANTSHSGVSAFIHTHPVKCQPQHLICHSNEMVSFYKVRIGASDALSQSLFIEYMAKFMVEHFKQPHSIKTRQIKINIFVLQKVLVASDKL